MNRFVLLISLGLAPFSVVAQSNSGPRITALGMTGVVVQDAWSVQANQAGLAGLRNITVAGAIERKFFNPDLGTKSAVVAFPHKQNVFGISFQNYGFSFYNEQKAGFTYAKRFGTSIYVATNINYHQVRIPDYGSSVTYSVDCGLQYRVNDQFLIGVHLANPTQGSYQNNELNASIPVKGEFGIAYSFSDKVSLNTAVVKVLNYNADLRTGIEYVLINWLALRGGLSANPMRHYAGFGVNINKLGFDVAASSHPVLGYSPQVALSYEF